MAKLILLIGGNTGDIKKNLAVARQHINKKIGVIKRVSGLYQTAAWGNIKQPDFLNQVVIAETKKNAGEVMNIILEIEQQMGRKRTFKNAPRLIDIDILFYDKDIHCAKNLSVPHPQIQNRRFVLVPLNELIPQFKHPVFNKSVHELLLECKDRLEVKKIT